MKTLLQLHVLVVDDHMLTRQFVQNTLRDLKIEAIDTSPSGDDALPMIGQATTQGTPYDIIFLDWSMPGISGFEVLQNLRSNPQYGDTAIVMFTAESEQRSIMQAIKAGATSYIVKPVAPDEMAKKVAEVYEWLKRKRMGDGAKASF